VRDVVIGVPGWWNDRQRRALLDATQVAGLNCLQLINELTACALELGIRKVRARRRRMLSVLICL
jgi:heat shock protein 4